MKTKLFLLSILFLGIGLIANANEPAKSTCEHSAKVTTKSAEGSDKLVVLWATGDKEVAEKMLLMYTFNSKRFKWWDDITLVIWGPSAKLLTEDEGLQDYVKKIMDQGTDVKACKGCADMYGVSGKLEELGIIVKYMGEMTDYFKEGRHILSL